MIVPAPVKVGLAVAAAGAIAAGAWSWRGDRAEVKESKAAAVGQKATAQTQTMYRVTDKQRQEIVNEARQEYAAKAHASELAASSARADADRLRKLLANPVRAAAGASEPAAGADGPTDAEEVLGSCVGEYQSMGEDADGVADRLGALQSYTRKLQANQVELIRKLEELSKQMARERE